MITPALINPNDTRFEFPDVSLALEEPNGLLAIGGDLSPQRLLSAYRRGIFPWFNPGEPILWWSPDPRAILWPDKLKISRSLKKTLNRGIFTVTTDLVFDEVVAACAEPRQKQKGTWITGDMRIAYGTMHQLGHAHSVECWRDNKLVGGLYGMAIGQVFFGESMFSREKDASKVALVTLADKLKAWGYQLIDCQVPSKHLSQMGAEHMTRDQFCRLVETLVAKPPSTSAWKANWSADA